MSREDVFRRVFAENYRPLMAYALRRAASRADAEEVVADAFTVAWRRFDQLPQGEREQRLWLYGVARRTLANNRRTNERAERLRHRLRPYATDAAPSADSYVEDEAHVDLALLSLAGLSSADQELLRLAFWEGLNHSEIAKVVDTPVPNVAVRLHRARKRLKKAFEAHMQGQLAGGHEPNARTMRGPLGQESRGG